MTGHDNLRECEQAPMIAFFARDAHRIDTAGAVVLLRGDEAIKIRRAIRLPFLDYSTLEKRRAAAEAEIALNRDSAPHIYIEASPIVRTREGYALGRDGEIVDWATRMRRFDVNATLEKIAARGELSERTIRELAAAIHAMHSRAPQRDAASFVESMRRWIGQNSAAFAERPGLFPAAKADEIESLSRNALRNVEPLVLARGALGRVRRCHGDLHLGNVVLIEGKPTPFDAIEFDESIAIGDILYDLAFTVMDLWERDLKRLANALLNFYLMQCDAEDYSGLALLPLFLSLRAAIRAKATAGNLDHLDGAARAEAESQLRRYFDFAARFLKPAPARLIGVGGLSGAGKSALAQALAPELGRAPGAVLLRSDVERKHLFGVSEETKLPPEAYGAEVTHETYARLSDKARRALEAGASVIVDATHARSAERESMRRLASAAHVPFAGLWLEAPLATRIARIGARRGDASDADEQLARTQLSDPLTEQGWVFIEASAHFAATLAAARTALPIAPELESAALRYGR